MDYIQTAKLCFEASWFQADGRVAQPKSSHLCMHKPKLTMKTLKYHKKTIYYMHSLYLQKNSSPPHWQPHLPSGSSRYGFSEIAIFRRFFPRENKQRQGGQSQKSTNIKQNQLMPGHIHRRLCALAENILSAKGTKGSNRSDNSV